MLFSEYLCTIESTEQELKLIETLAAVKNVPAWTVRLPFIGKVLSALITLADSENFDEFRQTDQYNHIKDWNVTGNDIESSGFSITLSDAAKKKIAKIVTIIGAAVFILWLYKKIFKRSSNT